jgi:hypothetical protein
VLEVAKGHVAQAGVLVVADVIFGGARWRWRRSVARPRGTHDERSTRGRELLIVAALVRARIAQRPVEQRCMANADVSVTLSSLRNADEIIIAGEALKITVQLHALDRDAKPEFPSLRDRVTMKKLERAGKRAVRKGMGRHLRVTTELRGDGSLLYRLTGYKKLGNSLNLLLASRPGVRLQEQALKVMSRLTSRVENIASKKLGSPFMASAVWEPAPGLLVSSGIPADGTAPDPDARLHALQMSEQFDRSRVVLVRFLGGLLLVGGAVAGVLGPDYWTPQFVLASVSGLMLIVMSFLGRTRISDTQQEIRELRDQQDLRDLLKEERERRAQKQFQVHSHQLRRYYDQALQQRRVIFGIGVVCIGAGFGIILAAGILIWLGDAKLSKQIVIAALGAVGGILANFIAVMYLNMFKETIRSIGAFHDRLVFTNHLHFANVLAAKVTDDATRDQLVAGMAQAMADSDTDARRSATAE